MIGGEDDGVACFENEVLGIYTNLCFAIEDLDERIEWSGVFAEPFSFIEGKKSDVARRDFDELFADNARRGVFDRLGEMYNAPFREFAHRSRMLISYKKNK